MVHIKTCNQAGLRPTLLIGLAIILSANANPSLGQNSKQESTPSKDASATPSDSKKAAGGSSFDYQLIDQNAIYSLSNPEFQKELEMTAQQINSIKALTRKLSDRQLKLYKQFPELQDENLDPQKRKAISNILQKDFDAVKAEIQDEALQCLVPNQRAVLSHLKFHRAIHYYGFVKAVTNSPFKEKIKTTEAQVAKLKKLKEELSVEIQKLIEEKKREGKMKMLKIFSPTQRKAIQELEGKVEKPDWFNY